MAGLRGATDKRDAGDGGSGDVSGAWRVGGAAGAIEAGRHRAFPEHSRDDVVAVLRRLDFVGHDDVGVEKFSNAGMTNCRILRS